MTNSNLVDFLGRQTMRRVGLASYEVVQSGTDELKKHLDDLRTGGVAIALIDCLDETHMENICRAAADLRLISGSSAFGMKLPAIWRERGLLDVQSCPPPLPVAASAEGCLLVAGSCSAATLRQNAWWEAQGSAVRYIRPADLLDGGLRRAEVVAEARRELSAGRHYLLTTSGAANEVRQAQEWGARKGLSVAALGEALASGLAELAREVLDAQRVGGLIAAGGETSGALCRRLQLGALRVGRNIEPGVPLCYSLGQFRLPLVLKSGNFGSADFYRRAVEAVAQSDRYLDL